jgi:hypothetical protein
VTLSDFHKLAKRHTLFVIIISIVNAILSISSGKIVGSIGGAPHPIVDADISPLGTSPPKNLGLYEAEEKEEVRTKTISC